MKKRFWNHVRIFLLATILILTPVFTCHLGLAQTLTLTVFTNKTSYVRGETVALNGTLTFDAMPVADSVVGLEVDKPNGDPLVVRACTTGSTAGDWSVEVLQVYPCDISGNPKSSFQRGTLAHYTIVVRNNENVDKNVTIALNLYYSGVIPLKVSVPLKGMIGPGNQTIVVSDPIPTNAASGTYTIYADAFSELPVFDGYAYSPEKSANFNVTSTLASSLEDSNSAQTLRTIAIDGSYSLYFGLSPTATYGNYTVYASSYYQGQLATAHATFALRLVGDINHDDKVDGKDIAIAAKAFGTKPGDLLWNAQADVNSDGKIDGKDIAMIAKNFGQIALSVTALRPLASLGSIKDAYMTPYSSAPVAVGPVSQPLVVLSGGLIDVFVGTGGIPYPAPYGGQGQSNVADMFEPQKTVCVYALVTYNGDPVQSKLVTFIVISPHGYNDFSRTAITNSTGYAYIEFGLPWPCVDPVNEIFGIWNITVQADILSIVVEDTVAFKVWWLIETTSVVPGAAEFVKGDQPSFDITFRTYRMQPINGVLEITLYDDLGVPFASTRMELQSIGWRNYTWCTFKNYKFRTQFEIPRWAFAGTGTAYLNFLHYDPANPYHFGLPCCPEISTTFIIKPII